MEYFTIGHPQVFHTSSPTLLAIGWGVIATWWVGLALGLAVAIAARAGTRPKRDARSLLRPICLLLTGMAICALPAGVAGASLASRNLIFLPEPLGLLVPSSQHVRFLADAWAHSASYLSGVAGGLLLAIWTWRSRRLQPLC